MKLSVSILVLICLQLAASPLCFCHGAVSSDKASISSCCHREAPVEEGSNRSYECPDCPHCNYNGKFVSDSTGFAILPLESTPVANLAPAPRSFSSSAPPTEVRTSGFVLLWTVQLCSLLENRAYFGVFLI